LILMAQSSISYSMVAIRTVRRMCCGGMTTAEEFAVPRDRSREYFCDGMPILLNLT
jgi:hypothetical protein